MANQAGNANKMAELRARIFFLLGAIVVYRIGSHIPVPGINIEVLQKLFQQGSGTILDMFNMFSGGSLNRFSVFALGVMPYISASIIVQMLSLVLPSLEGLRKEGESGRRKLTQYTRMGTVALAIFQGIGACVALQSSGAAFAPGVGFIFVGTLSLLTGTMFLMWLGEQITERGIGNGISMLIFAGIVAGLPSALTNSFELVKNGDLHALQVIFIIFLAVAVTYAVVYIERAQRRIPIQYAQRQQGRKVFAAQTSHLPFKLNMSGVIPPIFASSIILFPASIIKFFGGETNAFWQGVVQSLSPGNPLYIFVYAGLIVFFCFFYTSLVTNTREMAENLKKNGAFVPGIRPGQQTSEYLDGVLSRLTVAGAVYITLVCLLPEFLIQQWKVPFYFGGTSLLILVVVVMDLMSQIQSHLISHQYEGVMRKANKK